MVEGIGILFYKWWELLNERVKIKFVIGVEKELVDCKTR